MVSWQTLQFCDKEMSLFLSFNTAVNPHSSSSEWLFLSVKVPSKFSWAYSVFKSPDGLKCGEKATDEVHLFSWSHAINIFLRVGLLQIKHQMPTHLRWRWPHRPGWPPVTLRQRSTGCRRSLRRERSGLQGRSGWSETPLPGSAGSRHWLTGRLDVRWKPEWRAGSWGLIQRSFFKVVLCHDTSNESKFLHDWLPVV